jgi:hypothetical protein
MQRQLPTRSGKTVEIGQEAMKVLFKEPIKEAVKETLAEEELIVKQRTLKQSDDSGYQQATLTQQADRDESDDSGNSLFDPKIVIPAVALLGIALAIRQLGEGSLDTEKIDEMIGGETKPPMEEDMSKSAPSNPENSDDDETEEVNV